MLGTFQIGTMLNKRRARTAWMVGAALTLTWGLYLLNIRKILAPEFSSTREDSSESEESGPWEGGGGFVIRNPGCSIPWYPPFAQGVRPFLETGKPPVDCIKGDEGKGLDLPRAPIESNASHVYVARPFDPHSCCYETIRRKTVEYSRSADNSYDTSKSCVEFPAVGLKAETKDHEFMRVTCKVSHGDKHLKITDYHAFPIRKEAVEKRCEEKSSKLNREEKKERLNILIIGLDATSRLNFHRQMPETREFLEEMGAVELSGYNKVADNTFPNVVPLMTGLTEKELKKLCWPKSYEKLDDCPWLWHRFEERGYRTMMAEDAPNIGIFNFERLGFRQQPSDYYMRPFVLAAEQTIGHYSYPTVLLCLGPRLEMEVILGYTTKFAETFFQSEHPSFAFAWSTTMTHDGLALTREADPVVVREMRRVLSQKARSNTAMLFLSDHGVRAGEFRQTPQGSQEERLPYAFLVLPPSYRKRFPEAMQNLRHNGRRRLTTPFDLYYTLVDLLTPGVSLSSHSIKERSRELLLSDPLPRGISLFLPVPKNRKCKDAGITPHWCTCVNATASEDEGPQAEEVRKAGKTLVKSINSLLGESEEAAKRCASLSLGEVLEARAAGDGALMVTIKTKPGGAVFEGTMETERKEVAKGEEMVLGEAKTAEDGGGKVSFGISRLNRYGNQSACISDYHLKLFCYCIDQDGIETLPNATTLKGS